jgi:hypothetical protein
MTITEIQKEVKKAKKPMARPTVYFHLNRLKIEPVSKVRQKPQIYPDDAADQIIKNLGLKISIQRKSR